MEGYSCRLRHMRKNRRVCVGFVGDALKRIGAASKRVATTDNVADIATNALQRNSFLRHRSALGLVHSA
eukprot:11159902-Alexandrium_andersonii.AAC.1